MYDFWYSLGAAVVDPGLLDAISKARPEFTFVERTVVEKVGANWFARSGPRTGLAERDSTTRVRVAIAKYLKVKNFPMPPPIGIYSAGRFCQLMNIPFFQSTETNSTFRNIIRLTHQAFTEASAAAPAPALATLPAALGMCLLDGQISGGIRKLPKPGSISVKALEQILGEFHIDLSGPHGRLLKLFVKDPQFKSAVNFLMAGDENPWDRTGNTLEQAVFWIDDGSLRGEHVVP